MKKVLITGATGLIGTDLKPLLIAQGWQAVPLRRPQMWDPERAFVDRSKLEGFDAIVHLAGESIADGRWNQAKKERIRRSRVEGTRLLAEHAAQLDSPPKAFISASAIGYYGDRGDEILTEQSAPGASFLAQVCREWEKAGQSLNAKGVRVVHVRTGIVLSERGGALAKMLTPFKLGLGGTIGSGKQYMSWIDIADLVGLILHALKTETIRGPLNGTAPFPVTNAEFTKTLGQALRRPTFLAMPAFAARLALGEMADELLLASARVQPEVAIQSGYEFRYPRLEASLMRRVRGRALPTPQGV